MHRMESRLGSLELAAAHESVYWISGVSQSPCHPNTENIKPRNSRTTQGPNCFGIHNEVSIQIGNKIQLAKREGTIPRDQGDARCQKVQWKAVEDESSRIILFFKRCPLPSTEPSKCWVPLARAWVGHDCIFMLSCREYKIPRWSQPPHTCPMLPILVSYNPILLTFIHITKLLPMPLTLFCLLTRYFGPLK